MVSIHDHVLDVWMTEYFNDGERSCMTVVVKLLHTRSTQITGNEQRRILW